MDGAEFIVVFNDTKISMKQRELAEKLQFWPKCKGGTLSKNLEIGHLFGREY